MQRVLSSDLWKTVRAKARKARRRQAAIAYVTQDLIGFRKGDTLMVDASTNAIASGETDAKLLRKLYKRGVRLYHCPCLHAKVLLLDEWAVIGSGNMSKSSADGLVEVGVMTDHSSTVAGVASFIEQLLPQSTELQAKHLAMLCKIKVVRRGGRLFGTRRQPKPRISRLGNRTWMVGIYELKRDPRPSERKKIEQATRELRTKVGDPDFEPSWIKWSGKSRFRRQCRKGDSVIQIWRSSGDKRPSSVYRSVPVLLKQSTRRWTRFYQRDPTGSFAAMSWGKFKRLLKELGYAKRVGPGSTVLLDSDLADAINRKWRSAAKL
jgi:hypothetical protein